MTKLLKFVVPFIKVAYDKKSQLANYIFRAPNPGGNMQHFSDLFETKQKKAVMLAIFLGVFGLHRFYLHQNVRGLLYLLFFWTLIPSFLGIIDGIFLGLMNPNEFEEEFNLV